MLKRGCILDTKKGKDFISQFNLKKVVAGRGHDCGGLLAHLYIKGRKIAEYTDDGWGGEVQIDFESDAKEAEIKSMLKEVDFAKLMFENGWDFLGSANEIHFQDQVCNIVEMTAKVKEDAKLMKRTKNRLVIVTDWSTSEVSWTNLKDLNDLNTFVLQKTYDKYKKEFNENERYLNTDEQLLGLGIKL